MPVVRTGQTQPQGGGGLTPRRQSQGLSAPATAPPRAPQTGGQPGMSAPSIAGSFKGAASAIGDIGAALERKNERAREERYRQEDRAERDMQREITDRHRKEDWAHEREVAEWTYNKEHEATRVSNARDAYLSTQQSAQNLINTTDESITKAYEDYVALGGTSQSIASTYASAKARLNRANLDITTDAAETLAMGSSMVNPEDRIKFFGMASGYAKDNMARYMDPNTPLVSDDGTINAKEASKRMTAVGPVALMHGLIVKGAEMRDSAMNAKARVDRITARMAEMQRSAVNYQAGMVGVGSAASITDSQSVGMAIRNWGVSFGKTFSGMTADQITKIPPLQVLAMAAPGGEGGLSGRLWSEVNNVMSGEKANRVTSAEVTGAMFSLPIIEKGLLISRLQTGASQKVTINGVEEEVKIEQEFPSLNGDQVAAIQQQIAAAGMLMSDSTHASTFVNAAYAADQIKKIWGDSIDDFVAKNGRQPTPTEARSLAVGALSNSSFAEDIQALIGSLKDTGNGQEKQKEEEQKQQEQQGTQQP